MKYHIDRRVILSQESEFENLYKWSLQELDSEGKKTVRGQIPWDWSLFFTVRKLTLSDSLEFSRDDEDEGNGTTSRSDSQRISAILRPGKVGENAQDLDVARYSMFGTGRTISEFRLEILPLERDDQQETCTAWGCVSFTSEVDSRDETFGDAVSFSLFVRPGTFDRFAQKIATSQVDEALFMVSGVEGIVEKIELRYTTLRSTDKTYLLPNNQLFTSILTCLLYTSPSPRDA